MQTAIIIVLGIALCTLLWIHLKKNRKHKEAFKATQIWVKTFSHTLEGLQGVMQNVENAPDWSGNFCAQTMHDFEADGAVMYVHPNSDQSVTRVRHLCGICRNWNLAISTETISVKNLKKPSDSTRTHLAFEPEIPSDFYWSRQPHIYVGDAIDPWLPPIADQGIRSALATPIKIDRADAFLLLLRCDDKPDFGHDDQMRLGHCVSIAEAGFMVIEATEECGRMERELQSAHEEGMLQISTGIIHNIGNGITVIQLALERMKEGDLEALNELATFMRSEILTVFTEKLADGTLQDFLQNDPQGQEYLGALNAVAEQIPKTIEAYDGEIEFVIDKFRNVTEIITLQQQFIGELGTENVASVNAIVEDALLICQEALEQSPVKLVQALRAKHRVLVDTAMLRHMILLLIKYAMEAAAASRRADPTIKIETDESTDEASGKTFVTLGIFDNGAGRDVLPDEDEVLADRRSVDEEVRNLLFIKRRVVKYGGHFEIQSEFGMGTRITIKLPSYETTNNADGGE